MNFREICQRVAAESGTVSADGQPSSVTAQTGRLARVVQWVKDAWLSIQNERPDWRWMLQTGTATLNPGQRAYTPADLAIPRFAQWVPTRSLRPAFSIWRSAQGVPDERPLGMMDWDDFLLDRNRGQQSAQQGIPQEFAIDDQDALQFYPTPDQSMTVRLCWRVKPQELLANTDIPEMPERFHNLILYEALVLLGTYDENRDQTPLWMTYAGKIRSDLMRDQMDHVRRGPPLA